MFVSTLLLTTAPDSITPQSLPLALVSQLLYSHICKHLDSLFPNAQQRRDKSHYSHFVLPETPTVRLRLMEVDLQGSGKSHRMTANRGSRWRWSERVWEEMGGGCLVGRSFFNAPALRGWWQAESLSLALMPVVWLIWKELQKLHRGDSPCPHPRDMHRFSSAVGRAAPSGRQWWRGRVGVWSEGMMAGHYSAAPQDRPPSIAVGFLLTSSFRLSIYSSVHLSHRPGVYRPTGSNYDVEVRGGWVHRHCCHH